MISIGSFEIRYYGLMWALALGISAYVFSRIIKREGYPDKLFDSIFWYGVLSTIIGARLGHRLFYDPGYYLTHPVEILYIHQGGLARHGAAVGLLVGLWLFSRKNKMPYIWSLDRIAIAVGIAGALVRIGNLMDFRNLPGHDRRRCRGDSFSCGRGRRSRCTRRRFTRRRPTSSCSAFCAGCTMAPSLHCVVRA